jgi:uncharacterized peroxidase-related enzyme
MSDATRTAMKPLMEAMFLPEVENNPQPGPYADAIRAMRDAGREYPQIWHMFAFKPRATEHLARFTQEVLREPAPLTPGFRELIAAFTSTGNRCPFCARSHVSFAAALLNREGSAADAEEYVESAVNDLEHSALSEKEKALLRFVGKVSHDSPRITAGDMEPLRELGWTDEELWYAITICALFNFYNRWIFASGVHELSREAHRQAGERSADAGYVRK